MVLQNGSVAPKTDELANFLCKLNQKRTDYHQRRVRNLRIEAVLEAALQKARLELEKRQKLRKRKWLTIKQEWLMKNRDEVKRRRKSLDAYEWCPNQNGQWGLENKQRDDLFNLEEFFNDLNSFCQRSVTCCS